MYIRDFGIAYITQCTPGIFNLDQKFHGLSCIWRLNIHETVQNQPRKTSVIRLPKFTTVKWLGNALNMQVLVQKTCFLRITVLEA